MIVSTDKTKLDRKLIYTFLEKSYWAKGRSRDDIDISIENSVSFGLYDKGKQIGFARVLTDYSVFAYIMDVFIIESQQGRGYGKFLMDHIMNFPSFSRVNTWALGTSTAHDLYRKYGFELISNPENMMRKILNS
ncbi:GNAT family N-acetyltransferase [Saprospiraceae bacterium]|nr:GNAT family N-acetyltransferase [Saprospiraceae bacterium]